YEAGGIGLISGVQCRPVRGEHGVMDPGEVEAAVRGIDIHLPRSSLLCLENTNNVAGGTVVPLENFDAMRAIADRHGMKILLDGARLFHAALAAGVDASEYAARADLAWVALSKGLSAPVGSVVCGTAEDVRRARRIRKVLGGGMRQVGVLAAAGRVALATGVARLADDPRRARRLAEAAAELPGTTVDLERTLTNIVLLRFDEPRAREVADRLAEHGVLAMPMAADRLRFCTHRLIDDDDVERATHHLRLIVS
ncbi:MAG: GntG family PLP-dependent aldolase, partial [Planctomycetota bacterium JB042]